MMETENEKKINNFVRFSCIVRIKTFSLQRQIY